MYIFLLTFTTYNLLHIYIPETNTGNEREQRKINDGKSLYALQFLYENAYYHDT